MLRADSTTSRLRCLASLAVGLAVVGASAPALAQEQVENGFALQANLAAKVSVFGTVLNGGTMLTSVGIPSNGLDTTLFGGYKLGRLLIGLGLEFQNGTMNTTAGNTSTNTSVSQFLIGPEAQFAIVRAGDGRVELVGDAAFHFGHAVGVFDSNNLSNFLFSYQVAPGVRFWAHKNFALTALTGFSGTLVHVFSTAAGATGTSDLSANGIFGSFGMMGVF